MNSFNQLVNSLPAITVTFYHSIIQNSQKLSISVVLFVLIQCITAQLAVVLCWGSKYVADLTVTSRVCYPF